MLMILYNYKGAVKMIAEVILNSNIKNLNKTFDYIVPKQFEENINIGSRVFIPFANKKSLEEGFVIGLKQESRFANKEIEKIEKGVSEDKVEFAKLMAKRYFCNISDCIKLMLPPGSINKKLNRRAKEKLGNFVYLKKYIEEIDFEIQTNKLKSEKQIKVLNFLKENDGILISDLELIRDVSRAVINTLNKNNYIYIIQEKIDRNPFINKNIKSDKPLHLNSEQQFACDKVTEKIEGNQFCEFLLYGVTGSR